MYQWHDYPSFPQLGVLGVAQTHGMQAPSRATYPAGFGTLSAPFLPEEICLEQQYQEMNRHSDDRVTGPGR